MESPQIQPRQSSNTLSIAQLIVSGLGILSSLLAAGGIAILGVVGLFSESISQTEVTLLLATAWISLLVAVLAAPSLVYSIQRLGSWIPALPRIRNSFRLASILLLVWPLVLLLGNLIARSGSFTWLLLPPLGLLAIGLPVWWLVEFTRRKIFAGSLQRSWGLVSFSMLITTPLLMLVEVLVLLVLVLGFAVWLSTQPELMLLLQRLVERLSIGQPDPQKLIELVSPYLQDPWVIFGVLAVVAGLVPLIEELLKPLAMWALVGHKLTPAQGFAAGAICGGTFALIESLFYLNNPVGENWAMLAAGRASTGLLHITTTALLGWALAAAWQNGSYLRLGATYLLSSALHGLWNALSILGGLVGEFGDPPAGPGLLNNWSQIAQISLGVLIVLLFVLMWWGNQRLVRPVPQAIVETQPL